MEPARGKLGKLSVYQEKVKEYEKPRITVIYNWYKFQNRVQSDTDKFDQLVTDLKLLIRDCNYYDWFVIEL